MPTVPDDDWKSPEPGRARGLGRSCDFMLLPALLLMPYALVRYAIDERRAKRGKAGGRRG